MNLIINVIYKKLNLNIMFWRTRQISKFLAFIIAFTIFPILPTDGVSNDIHNFKALESLKSHSTIDIADNSGFNSSNGVVGGDGTIGNPYIIENWSINATKDIGIHIKNTDAHFIIRNCYVNGKLAYPPHKGIFLENVKNGIIENNSIINNSPGLYLHQSNNNIISNNSIKQNIGTGILIDNSQTNIISNNTMFSCGLTIYGQKAAHYDTNIIKSDNTVNNKPLYYWKFKNGGIIPAGAGQVILVNCSNIKIENQNLSNASIGIEMVYSNNIDIMNNTLSSNNFSILMMNSNNNRIINNSYCFNTGSIYSYGSNDNLISNNFCKFNQYFIYMRESNNNNIIDNFFNSNKDPKNNTGWGIGIDDGSYNNKILNNSCSDITGIGISVFRSYSNTLINNNCFGNTYGITIRRSDSNTIINNTCNWNRKAGINITKSDNNIIYNNYFNNSNNCYIYSSSGNIWNISKTAGTNIIGGPYLGGNYWSDYSGLDINDDGLGDTDLPHGPGDFLPLTDIFPPGIMDNTSGIPTTGDEFSFEAIAWDDNIVNEVFVEYWFDKGKHNFSALNRISGNLKNGTYYGTINISSNAQRLYYNISVMDTGFNSDYTYINVLKVIDNDEPIIIDHTLSNPTTGDNFIFNSTVIDNINVSKVEAEYWFNNGTHFNIALSLFREYYHGYVLIPINAKVLYYKLSAYDNLSNFNEMNTIVLDVIDNDAPFITDYTSQVLTTGEDITFNVSAIDNIEISSVHVEYWFNNIMKKNITLYLQNNFYLDNLSIPINTRTMSYEISAVDTSNNWAIIKEKTVKVFDNDKPEIKDKSSMPSTGDGYTFVFQVSDNIDISTVYLEYWFDGGVHTNITLGNNLSHSTNIPINAFILNALVTALDTSNNIGQLVINKLIIDNDVPIIEDLTTGNPETGREFGIKSLVNENHLIKNVLLEYWFDKGGHTFAPMNLETDSYNLQIKVPEDAKILYYKIIVEDSNNNSANIENNLVVIDIIPPGLQDLTEGTPITGDDFEIKAVAQDNIKVESLYLEYWFNNNGHKNVTFNNALVIIVSIDAERLHYNLTAYDMAGNIRSLSNHLDVIDNDAPLIIDNTSEPTTGDSFQFNAEIYDNIAIISSYLEFWFDNNTHINISFDGLYSTIAPNNAKVLNYIIFVEDGNKNTARIQAFKNVIDNDKPLIIDLSPQNGTTGDFFNVTAFIVDNILISHVNVEYWVNIEHFQINMELIEGNYIKSIYVPENATELSYKILAIDSSGNNQSLENKIEIKDNDRPRIEDRSSESEDGFNFVAIVQDNIGVSEVKVEYRFDNGENITKTLQLKEDNYEDVITNLGNAKRIYYTISAVDTSGNCNTTEENEIELIPSKPSLTSEHNNPWLILAIIIVIIVIVLIIFIVFIKRRKQKIKETTDKEATTPVLALETTLPFETTEMKDTPQDSEITQLSSKQKDTSETIENSIKESTPKLGKLMEPQNETDQNNI